MSLVRGHLGARDPESDVLYLYNEYFGEVDMAVHTAAVFAFQSYVEEGQSLARVLASGAQSTINFAELDFAEQAARSDGLNRRHAAAASRRAGFAPWLSLAMEDTHSDTVSPGSDECSSGA